MNTLSMLGLKAHKVRKCSFMMLAILTISLFLAMNTGLRFAAATTNCVADHATAKVAVCSSSYDPYSVTIVAYHCAMIYSSPLSDVYSMSNYTNDAVAITMDGSPTGFSTPHTFTGLTGVHNFTVPYNDPGGNPFMTWGFTGFVWLSTIDFTTITVYGPGTCTCYYDYHYYDVRVARFPWPAEYRYYITPHDPAVVAAVDNMTWGQIIDYVASHVSYNYNEYNSGNHTFEFPNETLKSGLGVCRDFASLCASMLIARGYDAYVVSGNQSGTAHSWVALKLGGIMYSIEPQDSWMGQADVDFSTYNAEEYVNTSGMYPPNQIASTTPPAVPGPDLMYQINSFLRMITGPVYSWIESATGNSLPPSISAALNYLFIEQPIMLCIVLLVLLVLVGIAAHFIKKSLGSRRTLLVQMVITPIFYGFITWLIITFLDIFIEGMVLNELNNSYINGVYGLIRILLVVVMSVACCISIYRTYRKYQQATEKPAVGIGEQTTPQVPRPPEAEKQEAHAGNADRPETPAQLPPNNSRR